MAENVATTATTTVGTGIPLATAGTITSTNVISPGTVKVEEIDYKALYEAEKAEREKIKASFDKASSETAEYKRKLSERLTKEEADKLAQEEREKAIAQMLEEREQLLAEKRVAHYTTMMVSAGISAETAGSLATDLPEGVSDTFFDGIKKFIEDMTAKMKADLLKEQPKLTPGLPPASADINKSANDALRKAFGFKN